MFQLGLVLGELFSGANPQRRACEFTDPVELNPLAPILGPFGPTIASAVNSKLQPDPGLRPAADELLTVFEGIFATVVDRAHALEGRAIW